MRIAIVNDVMPAVEAIRRVLVTGAGHQLAWVASNGAEAVALCADDRPDLILMDLIMPGMDGVEATRRIMVATPCAIVVVTAGVDDRAAKVFEALSAGALDAVNTPVLGSSGAEAEGRALRAKVDTIGRLLKAHPIDGRVRLPGRPPRHLDGEHLVAIGASAGGPAALAGVLARLPSDFPAAVVIVQHVDAQFAASLAQWLDAQTALEVRLAQEGDRPKPGAVLLAGRPDHLVLRPSGRLAYSPTPADCPFRPSVDVFFKSVDRYWAGAVTGVVLTGMGRDGAEGLQALQRSGHNTIAQDQASSAVYGMPRAAAELGAAAEILPLHRIGPRLATVGARRIKADG